MKKFTFRILTLLMLVPTLHGCGGGGGGTTATTPPPPAASAPTVTKFAMPATATTQIVTITDFTATDGAGVTGYLVTGSATPPAAAAVGVWSATPPTSYTFTGAGVLTVYAWAKNAAGEVSPSLSATVTVTLPPEAKAVMGAVTNPANADAPLAGVVVSAYLQGTSTKSSATSLPAAANGYFSLTGLLDGVTYDLVFRLTGYGDLTYYGVTPNQGAVTVLENVRMLPSGLTQTADINGYIRNAADNSGLKVQLQFRAGVHATTGALLPYTKTTDSTGYYERLSIPAGVYTVAVIDTSGGDPSSWRTLGYFTVYALPGVPTCNNSQNFTVSTGSAVSDYRAVLSWGNVPSDLDLHLTGPVAPGDTGTSIGDPALPRFHIDSTQVAYPYGSSVAFSSPTIPGAATDAYLDIDQADHGTDNGQEALTILTQRVGSYHFYVYNNSLAGTLAGSGAQVKLYKGAVLLQTFPVPTKSGTTWHVFDLEGETITAVNTITLDQTYTLAKRAAGNPFDELLLFRHVVKAPRVR